MQSLSLRQEAGRSHAEAEAIIHRAEAEKREMTQDEKRRFDELCDDREKKLSEANRLEHADALARGAVVGARVFAGGLERRSAAPSIGALADLERSTPQAGEIRVLRSTDSIGSGSYIEDGRLPSLARFLRGVVTGDLKALTESERRAASSGSSGAYLLPSPLSSLVIDLARNQARVIQAGAISILMDGATLDIARLLADPVASWRAENVAIPESEPSYGAFTLHARTLAALVRLSVELAEDATNYSPTLERVLAAALAQELDRACLFGVGAASEPAGLYDNSHIQTLDLGTNGATPDWDDLSKAIQLVRQANGEATAAVYNARTAGDLDRLKNGVGDPRPQTPDCAIIPKFITNQIPNNLVWGNATTASAAFIGDFSKLAIGMRTELTLEISREGDSAFKCLQVLVRAYLRADVVALLPSHFARMCGILEVTP